MFGMKNTKENRLEARKLYIPENAFVREFPELETVVYTFDNSKGKPCAMAFVGTASKPAFNYYYQSEEKRLESIRKFLADRRKLMDYKAERKQANKGSLTGSAATAKAIRERLKKEFPSVKFSVKSENFSMGNSVHISWTDGPVSQVVELITNQYQYGSFDGMTDSYNYREVDPSLGCPGAKYVSCNRNQSEERKAELEAHCIEKYGRVIDRYMQGNQFNAWYYENDERSTWKLEYKTMFENHLLKQAEIEDAERQAYLEELKAKEEQETRLQAEKNSPKVISLADRRKAKEAQIEADAEQEAQDNFEYITTMVSLMTNEQIADAIRNVYAKDDFTKEEKLATIKHFLSILAQRNKHAAFALFRELKLQELVK